MKENSAIFFEYKNGLGDFRKYLLAEYQTIARAHFNTISAISSFFRYYLILMAIPVALYSAIVGLLSQGGQFTYFLILLSSVVSFIVAIIGFFVLLYIVNLRMDAILYARTVNAIRKYFYDNADVDIDTKLRTRVLPQTATTPGYFEASYFLPVVVSFAIFNTIYLSLGMIFFFTPLDDILRAMSQSAVSNWGINPPIWIWVLVISFFVGHFLSYWRIAHHREHAYLKSYIIGVDIDGVLNKHRHHFCQILSEVTQKELDPECITEIPVHENSSLGVSRDDERRVFNNPLYWTEMPSVEDAAYNISKLKNLFKLKIYVFTHRPWPSEEIRRNKKTYKEWKTSASDSSGGLPFVLSFLSRKTIRTKKLHGIISKIIQHLMETRFQRLEVRPIDVITKHWLRANNIEYDKIIIERGSEDISDPQGEFRNRFYVSRRKKIRFFVEDDYEKAIKLSYICDVVFLVDQPYNRDKQLPTNILRVNSWNDIYHHVKQLS